MAGEIDLFRALDDPRYWEQPPGFGRAAASQRALEFAADLESRLSRPAPVETAQEIQDASFHSQILLEGGSLRFSNFGDMIAFTPDHEVPADVAGVVRELARVHGYRLVSTERLEEPYTGTNPGVTGISTWWIRYFDWV